MIRDFQPADLITLLNGFSGMGAVLAILRYQGDRNVHALWTAFILLPIALIFDMADGWIARKQGRVSALGQELDSLADLISFGVAPASLAFALGMDGGWDAVVLLYFVGCGISRLARFNATAAELADVRGKVKYFEGTPIPTSLVLVALLAVLAGNGLVGDHLPLRSTKLWFWEIHWLVLLWGLSGTAMISKTLRIPKP
ncbi:CDP-diacylglycerol--serine O-phosphatidyltransferase [Vulgatibacter incomptus]|nr:CDP-diacylglycerol--serine O-phosphatidyltransferase [Vulgatibacter incomptus]